MTDKLLRASLVRVRASTIARFQSIPLSMAMLLVNWNDKSVGVGGIQAFVCEASTIDICQALMLFKY